MTANYGNGDLGGKGKITENFRDERGGADDVQSGNTENPASDVSATIVSLWRDMHLFGSNTPCFLKTSATIGTVELTGFEITSTNALGAVVAMPTARSRTIPALI